MMERARLVGAEDIRSCAKRIAFHVPTNLDHLGTMSMCVGHTIINEIDDDDQFELFMLIARMLQGECKTSSRCRRSKTSHVPECASMRKDVMSIAQYTKTNLYAPVVISHASRGY